jgi:hypothetical protein
VTDARDEHRLHEREVALGEREAQLARGEARLDAAVRAQREAIRAREAELADEGRRRDDAAAVRAREAAELAERARLLDAREAELEVRCRQVIELLEQDAPRDAVTEAAVRLLEALNAAPNAAAAPDQESDISVREQQLEERLRSVKARERGLFTRAVELARREAESNPAVVGSPAAPRPEPENEPAPEPPKDADEAGGPALGFYDLHGLKRLVAAQGAAGAVDVLELEAYLTALSPHVGYDGVVPAEFDALIDDVFGDLLDEYDS